MKIKILFFFILISLSLTQVSAKGIPVIYSDGEVVDNVLNLPEQQEFTIQASDGKWYHANLGVLHEQFSLFWVPLFNYGTEKYVLYSDVKVGEYDFTYAELSPADMKVLRDMFSNIPATPELPFWDEWGGKILVLAIIGLVVLFGRKEQ